MRDFLQDYGHPNPGVPEPVCKTPSHLEGRRVVYLETEDLACEQAEGDGGGLGTTETIIVCAVVGFVFLAAVVGLSTFIILRRGASVQDMQSREVRDLEDTVQDGSSRRHSVTFLRLASTDSTGSASV